MDKISIIGARQNNLKNINVTIPRDKLVVITGVSGSGKSSLAFDTLYAAGQRRYLESLSSYARSILGAMDKPDVDSIEGLSPAIAIQQKSTNRNPRSTVGTITQVYDYYRLLFARVGVAHCPNCGRVISEQSIDQIVSSVLSWGEGVKIDILSPVVKAKKGEHQKVLDDARVAGFGRVRVDGVTVPLEDVGVLSKQQKHTIEIVVDRLILSPDIKDRLTGSIETALDSSGGVITIIKKIEGKDDEEVFFSQKNACPVCGISIPDLSSRLFSFNNPWGACRTCQGIGRLLKEDKGYFQIYGGVCPDCNGKRLRPEALCVTVGGVNIDTLCNMSITETVDFFRELKLSTHENEIAETILLEINSRLSFLFDVGVGYLAFAREAATLSGGEAQRLRLAACLGSALCGVMYVLDEPSIGLHQSDNEKLLATLKKLRDMGNTVIVVEHDEETLRAADYIIDIGPKAGVNGGKLVSAGTPQEIERIPESLTGQFLSKKIKMEIPNPRRRGNGFDLIIEGATEHNLKNVTVKIPLGTFICVTGVSGSGKSTLIDGVLFPRLSNELMRSNLTCGKCDGIKGITALDKVINIDQEPIGRSPRSNPATYTGVFNDIRDLFAGTVMAKSLGFTKSRFSFNVHGGRCDTCEGSGVVRISMDFLSDVYTRCDVCGGKRFNSATLSVLYKGRTISDVLDMSIDEAANLFSAVPTIKRKLETLQKVGLGYVKLGQNAVDLSGGEAQRVKLANELSRVSTGRTLYIMDEPTTGLHFCDVKLLMEVVQSLVSAGNTVIMIEHNLDAIRQADYIIDMGPGGGTFGGEVVATGTPEEVRENKRSLTGKYI